MSRRRSTGAALEEEIRTLEAARFAQGPHTRALAQRRMGIARDAPTGGTDRAKRSTPSATSSR